MKLFKYGVYALCASAMLSISSCFNLDEEPYSEIIEEDYVPTEADEIALLATTYSQLRFVMDWYGLFDLQEESGDVIVTPTRPNGWDDGGTYKQMHKHTWDNQQGRRCVKMRTFFFYAQSPDFHKQGLCYYLKILYL